MIQYPSFFHQAKIGVTAPSSGVEKELHILLHKAQQQFQKQGFTLWFGDTAWTQEKAKSASARKRASEFQQFMADERINAIIPPWGGELLIEIIELIDFTKLPIKWVMGYSDTSLLLLAITLKTGIATAHGPNLVDLRSEQVDATSVMWKKVLTTKLGESVEQVSSPYYQKEWDHSTDDLQLTETTKWKTAKPTVKVEGRLLGGCIDVIHHLVGTPFGDVQAFRSQHLNQDEPIIWYFENCEMSVTDLKRSFIQMKLAGWFKNCTSILFGRSAVTADIEGYQFEDVYQEIEKELGVPVIHDIDCGHVPPQNTFINGAYAEVFVENGKGRLKQSFLP
ncbi:S66 family peptidase [Alkalihalobacillus pseudalcaliphilus]|uniref:S66 family peptidase n=1 Tax=Alkalihalobacillus pseudalcaliphilus TaxID=79884 RepID=UPI00064D8A99|nr:S66 peptidase family protein [Alkalihalobacillus pseudalcaliphilus]KMK75497.1 peptidase S66 [Alkalihalobacillus pseudalcaliphilus]